MVTLALTVIDRVLKGFRVYDQPDVLRTAMGDETSTPPDVTISYVGILSGWGAATVVEIESELMLVLEVDTTAKVATVVRGWLGTDNTPHPINTPVYLNPQMMKSDILDLLNESIGDLVSHDLYGVDTVEITYDSAKIGYDLASDLKTILRVDARTDSAASLWDPVFDYYLVDNAPTEFASKKAIMLKSSLPFGALFRVVYSKAFVDLADDTKDLEADAGLAPYMTDLPFYFAMSRLMVDAERRRSQLKGAVNHQRAQDSPPFLSLRTGEWYQARYLDKINTSRARLRKETRRPQGTGYGS